VVFAKTLKKKWISIKFDLRVTKYVFIEIYHACKWYLPKNTGRETGHICLKNKKSLPENLVKKLKSDDNEKIKKSLGLKIDSNLNIINHNNKIIVPKELKLKNIQKQIRKPITPK
jgi:hypothetical protein